MSVESPQRYYAISKRVPKDVKRYCGICRQHNKFEQTRGHVCGFKDCDCAKCQAVRERRHVMSKQIKLRRAQDKCFQRTTDVTEADLVPLVTSINLKVQASENLEQLEYSSVTDDICAEISSAAGASAQMLDAKNMCYFCQKCKNHGSVVYKKNHKRHCPYVECTCDSCDLIETRRKLDQNIKRKKVSNPSTSKGSLHKSPSIKSSISAELSFNTSSSVPSTNFGVANKEADDSANISQFSESHSLPSNCSSFEMESISSSPNHIHASSPPFLNVAPLNSGSLISSFSPVSSNSECSANNFLQSKGFQSLFPALPPNFSSSSFTPSAVSSISSISQFISSTAVLPADDGFFRHSCGLFDPSVSLSSGVNQLLNSNDYFNNYKQLFFASILSQQQQQHGREEQIKNSSAFGSAEKLFHHCSDLADNEKTEDFLGNTPIHSVTPPSPISQEIVHDKLLQQLLKNPQVEPLFQTTREETKLSFKELENLLIYKAITNQQVQSP